MKKYLRMSSAAVVIVALRVNSFKRSDLQVICNSSCLGNNGYKIIGNAELLACLAYTTSEFSSTIRLLGTCVTFMKR